MTDLSELARTWLDEELAKADTELAHYGVLGMKWGVRKDDVKGSPRESKVVVPKPDKDTKMNTGDKIVLGGLAAYAGVWGGSSWLSTSATKAAAKVAATIVKRKL